MPQLSFSFDEPQQQATQQKQPITIESTTFLHQVAKRVLHLQQQHNNLHIVLPNQRAGLFLKQEMAKLVYQPIFLPNIVTIEEFFYNLCGLQKIEQTEQLFRLYESHKATNENPHSFDKFLRWAGTFLSDCNEIDTNLIDTKTFFTTLYTDREIRNWNINEGLTEMQQDYLAFWKIAEQLYNHFTQKLLNENKAYNGLAYRNATDNLEGNFSKTKCDYAVFIAFNALNRAEEKLFEYVNKNQLGEFIWDVDNYYLNDDENKAGQYFRTYRKNWKGFEQTTNKIGVATEQIQVLEAPNFIAQTDIASQLIEQLAQEGQLDGEAIGRNTAIILGDEGLLEPLLYRLPTNLSQKYNVTMGKAVAKFPLYHLFDNYLRLIGSLEKDSTIGFPTKLLETILSSPFIRLIDTNFHCEKLLNYIIENNISFITLNKIQEEISTESFLIPLLQTNGNISIVLEKMHWLIEQLRLQLNNQRIQKQVLFELKKIVTQFENLYKSYPIPTTIPAFRNLLKQVALSTTIPYEGEPLEGIQIMGLLETRALDFEHLIILGCNEGTLPKGKSGSSFIPYIFKEHFNIQTFKDKDAIYAYSFYRLLHNAKRIHLVYNGQTDNEGEQSRFITQLEAEFNEKTSSTVKMAHQPCSFSNIKPAKQQYKIDKTEEVMDKIEGYLQTKYLSPSSIKTLVNNPLDFYLSKIACIKEPKQKEIDIELNTFGSIVHQTLEILYKPAIGIQLTQDFLTNCLQNVEEAVNKIYLAQYKKGNTTKGMNFLMKQASYELVKQTILTDLERIKQHNIKIIALEETLEAWFPIEANGRMYNIKIQGNADRIQQRDDKIEIIDYKTGRVENTNLDLKHIDKIAEEPKYEKLHQILCYIFMASEGLQRYPLQTIRGGMQPLKSWNKQIIFINNDSNDYAVTINEIETYKEQLTLIIQDLLDPEIPFTAPEDEKRLEFSPYKKIYTN